jgi:hypothetical protein
MGVVFGVKELLRFSNEAGKVATQTEASVQRIYDIYGKSSNAVGDFIDANAQALGMSKSAMASFSAVYGNLFSVWADQATNAELTNQYLQMTAVVASKTGRTVEDVQERVRSGLLGNTEAIEDLGVFVNVKTIAMTDAFQRVADGKSWQQLDANTQQQIRTMAILEQATSKYGTEVANTSALTRSAFSAAYEDFKNTWGQVVNTVLLPVLEVATQILNVFTIGLQSIFGLSGGILGDVASSTNDISNNIQSSVGGQENLTEATKDTNKELKQSVAGFDELNTIQKDSAQSSSGSSGGGVSTSVSGVSPVGGGGASGKNIANEISETLLTIMGVVSIALIAIGLILLLFGQFKWGIGFLIAGALTLGITMKAAKKSKVGKDVAKTLSTIMGIVGGALVAIGIMLIMLGSTALGVGFIVAGAVSLIGSVATLAGFDAAEIKSVLSLIMGIAGGAMLALGIMLCVFAGPSPLSIGLIVAGAVSLASSVALNSNKIIESLRGPIGVITAIVSAALIVIGIILICTGVALPLGISLLAAGAIGLVTVVVVNWNTIVQKVKDVFNLVMNWVKTWGLLVLGIVLLFSGVGFALGLALIYQGAKNLTEAKDPKWLGFLEKVKTVWKAVKDYWNTNIAKYFTKEWWGNLAKNAINGFLKWIFNGLNKLIDKLNGFSFGLPDVLGGGRVGFNIKRLEVPQLAKGAVIPANKPFLAMLGDQKSGTNIETPLDTMVEAFNIALSNNNGGFNGRIEVPVIIDGREVLRAVRNNENAVGTQTVFGGFANAY